MPTGKSRNKRTSGLGASNLGNTSGHVNTNHSKQESGMNMPQAPRARDRAKDLDVKRRADAESNGL